jgi:hypothetical protein
MIMASVGSTSTFCDTIFLRVRRASAIFAFRTSHHGPATISYKEEEQEREQEGETESSLSGANGKSTRINTGHSHWVAKGPL